MSNHFDADTTSVSCSSEQDDPSPQFDSESDELEKEPPNLDAADEDEAWTHKHGSRLLPLPKDHDYVEVVTYDTQYNPLDRYAFRLGEASERPSALSAFAHEKIKQLSLGSIRAFRQTQTSSWSVRLGLEKLVPRVCLTDGAILDIWQLSENLEGVGAGTDERLVLFVEVQGKVTRVCHGHALREAALHLRVGGAGTLTPASGDAPQELHLLHRACPRDISPFLDASLLALTVSRSGTTSDSVKPSPGDLLEASVTWPDGRTLTMSWESGKGTVCDALELGALHAGAGESVEVYDAHDTLLVSLVMPDSATFSKLARQDMESRCDAIDKWLLQARGFYYEKKHALAYFLWSLAADLLNEDEDSRARWLRSRCLGNMAACRLSRSEPETALSLAENACQLYPTAPPPLAWIRVAKSAEGVGNYVRAIEAVERAEAAPGVVADAAVKALRARLRARAAEHRAAERAFCSRALASTA